MKGERRQRSRVRRGRSLLPFAVLLAVLLTPPVAKADTFINTNVLFPSGGAGTAGPANAFPSTIPVSGLSGTVVNVRVTLFGFQSSYPDDADVMISGPNGQVVTVLSDACGPNPVEGNVWSFDDSAEPLDLPNEGPCPSGEEATYSPTRWLPADDLSPFGGPPPPYSGQLASLSGGSPNGAWNLWALDDNESGGAVGFTIHGWALTLDITPSRAPAPAPVAVTAQTGERAAALKKCTKKKSKKKRRKCRRAAMQLPL